MTHYRLPKVLMLMALLSLVSACATSPIDKQYRQEARQDNLPFSTALCNLDACIGKNVVWGGIIIQTKNLRKGSRIIIMQTALDGDTRPIDPRDTEGRFIAYSPDFLDPELYQKSREVTVAGTIKGKKRMPIGATNYMYPVLTIKQIYLWEEEREEYPYGAFGGGSHWHWGRGFFWH